MQNTSLATYKIFKDFQPFSLYIKDLIAHMIGTENVVQNTLSKDRTYDN